MKGLGPLAEFFFYENKYRLRGLKPLSFFGMKGSLPPREILCVYEAYNLQLAANFSE